MVTYVITKMEKKMKKLLLVVLGLSIFSLQADSKYEYGCFDNNPDLCERECNLKCTGNYTWKSGSCQCHNATSSNASEIRQIGL